MWAHPSHPPSGRGQGAQSQAVGGRRATRDKGSLVGASGRPQGKAHRAWVCCPRCAQDGARLVAWDAVRWGRKEGAGGRTCGAALCGGGGWGARGGASTGDHNFLSYQQGVSANWRQAAQPAFTTAAHQLHGFNLEELTQAASCSHSISSAQTLPAGAALLWG